MILVAALQGLSWNNNIIALLKGPSRNKQPYSCIERSFQE